jgi:hypothetical protein
MKIKIYAMTVINPIVFPEDLEIQVVPLSPENDTPLGGLFSMIPHRSWEWIRSHYPIRSDYFDEIEGYLKAGQRANLVRAETDIDIPADSTLPAGAKYSMVKKIG